MTGASIDRYVPHRGAMSLLDTVTAADDASIAARLTVRDDGLFETSDGVPVLLTVEYMAQAVAAFAGARSLARDDPVQLGLLLGVRSFVAAAPYLVPGDALEVTATLVLESATGLAVFDCRVTNAGEIVASARLTVLRIDSLDDLQKTVADSSAGGRSTVEPTNG